MSGKARRLGVFAVLAGLAATAPEAARAHVPDCPAGAERFVEHRLFMGRSRGGVEVVTEEAWRAFLAEEVTPRFPDGLTVLDAAGQWRGRSGAVERERTKLLVVLAPPGAGAERRIGEIADAYKRAFGQESVLRAAAPACVRFQ